MDSSIKLSPRVDYFVAHPNTSKDDHFPGTWEECKAYLAENPGGKIYFDTPDMHLFPSRLRH